MSVNPNPDYVSGEWTVDSQPEYDSVAIAFTHVEFDGVEEFTTSMPCSQAREFAAAVIEKCDEVESDV